MKLLFPNGEHPQVVLSEGSNRIGSAPDAQVVLALAGLAPSHCEIQVQGGNATLTVSDAANAVSVNGRAVDGPIAVRPGDQLVFGSVQARIVAVEKAAASVQRSAPVDDSSSTRVRMAVPRFVLRGVSGAAFGKTYPIPGPVTIGRQQDCDIAVASEEISRRHATVKPTPDGLMVEDLGSANGTFINGKRVQTGLMRPGEELRLDTIRFLLVAPGMEIPSTPRAAPESASGGSKLGMVVGIVLALAAIGGAVWYFALR